MSETAPEALAEANADAVTYLESLLNKQLRVHTTDSRMFVGEFRCTDNV
jgi:N-alpha-acetyltransferase 38, NatC auxiliary subunit